MPRNSIMHDMKRLLSAGHTRRQRDRYLLARFLEHTA